MTDEQGKDPDRTTYLKGIIGGYAVATVAFVVALMMRWRGERPEYVFAAYAVAFVAFASIIVMQFLDRRNR